MKEASEGFLYISKCTNAKLIISYLPSSHKHWKEHYFFISGRNCEYNSSEVKRKLVKCCPRKYSELIRSDIPRPFGVKSSRPSKHFGAKSSRPFALRPSKCSFMKPSREELQARVEFLVKKKRSAKRKVPAAPESGHAARGKVPKLGASSSPSSILEQGLSGQFWARGHTPYPVAEVSEVTGPQLCSPRAVVAKSPPERTAKPPLDILPISVWSPST